MKRNKCWLILLALAFFLPGCKNQELAFESVGPSVLIPAESEQQSANRLEVREVSLSQELEDKQEWIVMDARGDQVLFAVQEKQAAQEETHSYCLTREIGIYDVGQSCVTARWEPEIPGWYQAGAMTGEGTACVAGAKDYAHVYPSEYALVLLDQAQEALPAISGAVLELRALEDGTAIFSFAEPEGRFGVRAVSGGKVTDLLTWQADGRTEPLGGGELSVCGSEFSYAYADVGRCVLVRANRAGELERQSLVPGKEKLDSCYLTREGMVACLSIDEDTDQFHRELTLLSGREDAQRRSGGDGALYRMRFGEEYGLAVDSQFRLYLLRLEDGAVTCTAAPLPEELQERSGGAVDLYTAGDDVFYLFYSREMKLYRVSATG